MHPAFFPVFRQKVRDFIVSPQERHLRMLVFEWYIVLAIIVFGVMALAARVVPYFTVDLMITQELQESRRLPLYPVMALVSWAGYLPQFPIMLLFVSLFVFLLGLRWESVVTFLSGFGSAAAAALVKEFINRPRPSQDLVTVLNHLSDTSFPSVHTVSYTSFFGFLWFLSYVLMKHSFHRTALLVLFASLVLLVGPSRIYLGEHWASDVLAAYVLGSVCLLVSIYFYKWGKTRFFPRQTVAGKSS